MKIYIATSQVFLKAPKPDADQLPMSSDGGLLDIHVTAFVTAIDSLLGAGRSPTASQVLNSMRTVVNAVSAVIEDVRTFERRQDRVDVDFENVRALRERAQATLSNLVTASKTHATSMGMSPVSLLDAAASHLSATITELGRTISIRKATKAEQDQFEMSSSNGSYGMSGYVPTLRSIGEIKSSSVHQRSTSSTSSRKYNESPSPIPTKLPDQSSMMSPQNSRRRAMSPSSSIGSSPPPLFDQSRSNATASDDSAAPEGPDEAWAELKVRYH